jgi:hypothetical protein
MRLKFWIAAPLGILFGVVFAHAQPQHINIHVKEAAGIRRSTYPVNARVPFAKGVLKDTSHLRLVLNDKEVGIQTAPESKWPDDSIQWLDVDFNATIMPLEDQTYQLEYGESVKATTAPGRGLAVNETADTIQVGSIRFAKNGFPLVLSATYRQEDIGKGINGFTIVDNAGTSHELKDAIKAEVVKPGPLYVAIRLSGKAALDANYSVPFTITMEMPNSKTWVKYSATVDDTAKRVREIVFNTPLTFGAFPWLWDFGTGSWSYGSFRNASDSVVLTQTVKAAGAGDWQIKTGMKGQEQLYEVAGGTRPKLAEGWGHFQDAKEVIAFGFDKFARQPGTYTVAFDGQGQAAFHFVPSQSGTQEQITVFQHYVASPTPIGAVTSPVSMLNALSAVCDRDQYTKSGVPVPKP